MARDPDKSSQLLLHVSPRENGLLFRQKKTSTHQGQTKDLYPLEREASPDEAEEGVEGVVAVLAVALVATATLTTIILTPIVALLHHLPQTVTLNVPMIPGGITHCCRR